MNKIKHAMDTTLSTLQITGAQTSEIISKAKGEHVVKKKLSISLAFALAIVLLAAAAIAASLLWEDYARRVKSIEVSEGYYKEWPIGEKLDLVRTLVGMGYIEKDEQTSRLLDGLLDNEEAHRTADDILKRLTNRDVGDISLVEITEALWGPYDTWTQEKKIWWQKNIYSMGVYAIPWDHPILAEPGADAILESEAVNRAKLANVEAFELGEGYFDVDTAIITEYYTMQGTPGVFLWYVQLTKTEGDGSTLVYDACIDGKTGEITTDKIRGVDTPANLRARREYVPGPALTAFTEALDELREVYDNPPYFFEDWPLEGKAEASRRMNRLAAAVEAAGDSEYVGAMWMAIASFTYGLPGEGDLTQDEARRLADEAILSRYNISADVLALYNSVDVYFDITNPDAPLWKFFYGIRNVELPKEQQPIMYKVEMLSRTGEIIKAEEIIRGAGPLHIDVEYTKKIY